MLGSAGPAWETSGTMPDSADQVVTVENPGLLPAEKVSAPEGFVVTFPNPVALAVGGRPVTVGTMGKSSPLANTFVKVKVSAAGSDGVVAAARERASARAGGQIRGVTR